MSNLFAEVAMMQAKQQGIRPYHGIAPAEFRETGRLPAPVPKPQEYVINSWFSAPRGIAYQIINELATAQGVKFQYEITGQTGWLFKRLYVRYKMTGEKQRIEHAQRWLISLGKEDSAD